jgi:DNA topoisomerase-2
MKSIEERYQKLDQREHVLVRSGMYIGSVERHLEEMWVFNSGNMTKKMVEYSPGFLKIFDEVLTNALDHSNRDSTVTSIKLDYNIDSGEISVWNNGSGVPIVEHKEHNVYVPELIFGHLLSGSNYDDNEKRVGAGLNGMGVKLANIFSKKFTIETIDSERGLKFVQTYTQNMSEKSKPRITKNSGKSYTKITFLPDYSRFGMSGLDQDTVGLLDKRIYDCVACTNKHVSIYLNGTKLQGRGLVDYAKYFFSNEEFSQISESVVQNVGGTEFVWEYIVVPWDHYEQVSFVNGNSTYQGGKHVDHILYQITNKIKSLLETRKKLKDVKPAIIREKMFLFLRATVVNPRFSSQTKEVLTTLAKDFGCRIEVSDKFIEKIWKSSIINEIVDFCKLKESNELSKATDGKKKNKVYIPKLEDALWAGTQKSDQCTLILTEGDSAKTFAMWGRSIVGAERFGVFPLKGKLLNVRDASIQQLIGNEEINNLKQIIGLQQNKEYTSTSSLRYGKVMCLTDSDVDGTHIKSLLVNFFHSQWPSLVKLNFIQTLRTPIIKAIKGKQVIEFFNEQDYRKWQEGSNTSTSNYQIRYFKGLGTSQKDDAKETFRRMNELKVDYYYKDTKCDEAILLAFEKDKNIAKQKNNLPKCTDQRKTWLSKYNRDDYVDCKQTRVSYQDLINKELIHFSIYDNTRSIPNLCDGLKPSQRKILYYMLNKNITKSIKVAQLSGYVSAETGYHHGENSLQQAIIGMAQNFIGTNNINLLFPDGNFGSRLSQGKDAASPRYIFTRLANITPLIFNKDDTPLLNMLNDDGQQIEPEWYMPVIPMILVNGCEGIGTGYSTYIPPFNPSDIIANIKHYLNDTPVCIMKPYFRGFEGEVVELENGSYMTRGIWQKISDKQIVIKELPVGTAVTTYKEFLESLIESNTSKSDANKKKNYFLKDVINKTVDENTGISFLVEFKDSNYLARLIESNTLEKELKLTKTFNINNMYLFDDNLVPIKYKAPTDILLDFCDIRLEFYGKRRNYLINKLTEELKYLKSKVRFISEYISGIVQINNKPRQEIVDMLEKLGYPTYKEEGYDYLIKLPIISLTQEKINELQNQTSNKQLELSTITNKTPKDLWMEDLLSISKLLA